MKTTDEKKRRGKGKVVILAIVILLVVIALPLAIVYGNFLNATTGQVPIVEKSPAIVDQSTANEEATPTDVEPAANVESGSEVQGVEHASAGNQANTDGSKEAASPIATPNPDTDPTLHAVEGTPDDIHEDVEIIAPVQSIAPIYKQVPISENTTNILLLGSDARPGETGGRSDTMMLFSYNRENGKVSLLSFMRDSWVKIDGHGFNRINAAYAFGGVGLSINTINENFGLDVQNYITVGFEEFIKAVDEIGGIELTLSQKEADYINKQNSTSVIKEGVNNLNGAQTLIHARNRHVGNGDFERTRRQREVLFAIFTKLKSIRDPAALIKVFDIVMKNVKTNVSPDLLFTLMNEMLSGKKVELSALRMPFDGTWKYAMKDGRSVLSVNIKKNAALIHTMLYE